MATITDNVTGQGAATITATELTTSDDFIFKKGARQILQLANDNSLGDVDITIVGDEASSSVLLPGTAVTVDASAGYTFTITDGDTVAINLQSISKYLEDSDNNPTITSSVAGVFAVLYTLV